MVDASQIQELKSFYPGATVIPDGGIDYIHIPRLRLPKGNTPDVVDALLCPQQYGGYTTRLFLSEVILGKNVAWTPHRVIDKEWHTWSWNNVPPTLRLAQILAEHLRALQ